MLPPIAYTIPGSCQASGFSRSAIYRLIKSGELGAVKHGKRTLILDRDLRKLLEKLNLCPTACAYGEAPPAHFSSLPGTLTASFTLGAFAAVIGKPRFCG